FEGVVSDPAWKPETGDSATLSIRPESWTITAESPGANSAQGRIGESIYLGEIAQYQFLAGSLALKIFEMNPQPSERPSDRELFACAAPRDVVVLRS
ncbi:MAG: TOBE domain-containing protein, partial [Terrimicrobiaceae bacterium]